MKKLFILILLGVLTYCHAKAQHKCSKHKSSFKNLVADDSRSDSLDVLHTDLYFDFSDFQSQELNAIATIDFRTRVSGIQEVDLDLLGLTVIEVRLNDEPLVYTHIDELLKIFLTEELSINEEFTLIISYEGNPETDASGWGGFYWTPNYAYNLGVGFDADPHTFGRAWFPCFDSFIERCTFSFSIKTDASKTGIANGTRLESSTDEDGLPIAHWELNMSIPSYLASIAVGSYEFIESTYSTANGIEIPQYLIAPPASVDDVSASFINLPLALNSFEEFYGPYEWERVGYVFVPFNSGAMEHATNIAYPISFADGGLDFETLMAHELAHHWWGDLITCSTQEDMWINEGMASYSEALFLEQTYGDEAYYEWISENHRDVLLSAHSDDGGYLPVSGIGHANTYGTHVYSKGASVGHNLRTYMGTEAFVEATVAFMSEFALQSVSSADLRDFFQDYTDQDLVTFFNDWVFNPGFTDFNITAIQETELSPTDFQVDLTISQRSLEAPEYFTQVPLTVTLISEEGAEEQTDVIISGHESDVIISSSFSPKHIILNRNYELTPAILAEEKTLTSTGTENFSYAEFRTNTSALGISDSIWVRAECHFTGPNENIFLEDFYISSDRFWRIHADVNESSEIESRIYFYGSDFAFFDYDLPFLSAMNDLGFTVPDLKLLHRPLYSSQWVVHSSYTIENFGDESNFNGYIDFDLTSSGDYAWGFINNGTYLEELESKKSIELYPNPVEDHLSLNELPEGSTRFRVYTSSGKVIMEGELRKNGRKIKCQELAPGHYIIELLNASGMKLSQSKFIKT
ncbi:MAG: M1 family aminopeptidase [Flavobacteriales bacterium]